MYSDAASEHRRQRDKDQPASARSTHSCTETVDFWDEPVCHFKSEAG